VSGEEERADGERLARLHRERAKPRDSSLGGFSAELPRSKAGYEAFIHRQSSSKTQQGEPPLF